MIFHDFFPSLFFFSLKRDKKFTVFISTKGLPNKAKIIRNNKYIVIIFKANQNYIIAKLNRWNSLKVKVIFFYKTYNFCMN